MGCNNPMAEDPELLRRYAATRAEDAFAELVHRHVDLVYGAALRQVGGDVHRAQEVTQAVFTVLARKAPGLVHHTSLTGWLYTTTHFTVRGLLRAERRRIHHEQEAQMMHELSAGPSIDWERLRPVLDEAMQQLGDRDREVILARFFEGRPFADVGARSALTEDAARMRVDRALDKLRRLLERRGIASTSMALSGVLVNHAMASAPAGLAATVTGLSLAGGAVAGGGAAAGIGAFFAMSKIKTGIAAAVLAAIAVPTVIELRANRALGAELQRVGSVPDEVRALQRENQQLTAALGQTAGANPDLAELDRLRKRVAQMKLRPPGVADSHLKRATAWGNVGRATAEAANETFHWALFTGNVETVASLIIFDDDTPENREAFMAKLSAVVRERYPTPERVHAAAFFGAGANVPNTQHPNDAFQVVGIRPDDRPGQTRVNIWYSLASGREWLAGGRWQNTPSGWALAPHSLVKDVDVVQARFRPGTAEVIPFPAVEFDPASGKPLPRK